MFIRTMVIGGALLVVFPGTLPAQGYLGVRLESLALNNGDVVPVITEVIFPGPAHAAGLRMGDIITAIGDQLTQGKELTLQQIKQHRPGETVTLQIFRNGKTMRGAVTLGDFAVAKQQLLADLRIQEESCQQQLNQLRQWKVNEDERQRIDRWHGNEISGLSSMRSINQVADINIEQMRLRSIQEQIMKLMR